jgi:hypothetical protein
MNKKIVNSIIAATAIAVAAFAIWIVPVTFEGKGTVAAADEKTASEPLAAIDCSTVTWPNIPAECLTNASGGGDLRVISIPESRQG